MVAKKQAGTSSQSSSSRPAALTQTQQALVDEIRSFGRVPKRKKGASEEDVRENKLAKRLFEHKNKLPEDIWQELQQLQVHKSHEVQEDKADALCICNFSSFFKLFHFLCVFVIVTF